MARIPRGRRRPDSEDEKASALLITDDKEEEKQCELPGTAPAPRQGPQTGEGTTVPNFGVDLVNNGRKGSRTTR